MQGEIKGCLLHAAKYPTKPALPGKRFLATNQVSIRYMLLEYLRIVALMTALAFMIPQMLVIKALLVKVHKRWSIQLCLSINSVRKTGQVELCEILFTQLTGAKIFPTFKPRLRHEEARST